MERCKNEHEGSGATCNLEKEHKGAHLEVVETKKGIFKILRGWR